MYRLSPTCGVGFTLSLHRYLWRPRLSSPASHPPAQPKVDPQSTLRPLFGISALYHRFYWSPRWEVVWNRLDHSNIFLLIAGTYTPLSIAILPHDQAVTILSIVWGGALLGILLNLFWPTAPRWLATLIYVALGWVALWYLPQFWALGGAVIVWLLLAGGILYTLGAVVYATKKPDLSPRWFGFHEIFHLCTVLAWACHCVAVYLAVL